jgi:hypothetical protein
MQPRLNWALRVFGRDRHLAARPGIRAEVNRSSMRAFLKYLVPVLIVYVALLGGLFVAMLQPPAVFGHIMSKLPKVTYFLFPFEPMWLVARRGTLKPGNVAPDFTLKTADRSAEVRISSFRGQKPVILIFGSHT